MRKLLLSTTAIAASTILVATVAQADLSVTGSYKWSYTTQSSDIAATDGTLMENDSEIKFAFVNKTEENWTVGFHVEMETDTAGIDESNIYIIHTPGLGKLAAREGISAQKLLHGTHSAFFCGTSGCSILRALVTTLQKNANCITEPVTSAAASKCACHSGNSRASTSTRCSW